MICPELYGSINVEVKKLKNLIQLRPLFSDDPFRVSIRFFFLISTLHKGPIHTLHFILLCINHSIYSYFSIVMTKRSKSSLFYVISKLISDDTVGLNEKLFGKTTFKVL